MATIDPIDPFIIYKESKARLAAGKGDARDEVLVALWKTCRNTSTERNTLKQQNNFLTKQRSELAYTNQILESRVAVLTDGKISLDFEEVVIPTHH